MATAQDGTSRPGEIAPAKLDAITKEAGDFTAARPALLEALKTYYGKEHERLAGELKATPRNSHQHRGDYARLTDRVIGALFEFITTKIHPAGLATTSERMALIATGGYGRSEMAPYSDVDLLFLIPYKSTAWSEQIVETMLYLLWDMGFKLGHAVRSIDECMVQAADMTIRTSLLEARYLIGDEALADELLTRLREELFASTTAEFVEAKLDEREARHEKSGRFRYVLEPNVKESKGGLRDLQTLYWLGKYITGANTPEELVAQDFFEIDELVQFRQAEEFLWAVRGLLHIWSKRANDVLSFDAQVEIAAMMGYEDDEERRGVEIFMQDYFRAARHVGELTRVFLTALEARHMRKPRFSLRKLLRGTPSLPPAFKMEHERIAFVSESAITEDPLNMMRIFAHALEGGHLIHPGAFRLLARHHGLIDEKFRNNKEANRLFLSLILDHGNPERALRRMNEIGFLGAFIPQWARIDAMMQYNMYHSYTVDEHIVQCISNLWDLEQGKHEEDLPITTEILKRGVDRRVLYVALLLHDIGKGLARPHELVGEEIARALCPRLGLEDYQTELVAWLVRYHLELSDAAQKRDLSDPKTIADFAALVGDQEKLDLLCALTVCDIRAVGPKIWNNWKAMMIRELYRATSEYLGTGDAVSGARAREKAAKSRLTDALAPSPSWEEEAIEAELARHYQDYWLGLSTNIHAELAELARLFTKAERLRKDAKSDDQAAKQGGAADKGERRKRASPEPKYRFSLDPDRDATRASFVMDDHPGLFARLCGAMSLSGANIVDARSYTSNDGLASTVLWVQDDDGNCYEEARLARLSANVRKILTGQLVARSALAQIAKFKRRERRFTLPTRISFDNEGSQIFTIIEIDTRDRKGLVYDLARTLTALNISISSAIIATYGEQAVDNFYVKDIFGLKIHSRSKQQSIEAKLREAIEAGFQEAMK